ncbi:FAD-binding monooxygenase moxY [Fusarium oxysporum f. sp. albedinis]|nr:FAD-binding monooxygenase moxY [Fusarium oxysporum f. sp. albedinis]
MQDKLAVIRSQGVFIDGAAQRVGARDIRQKWRPGMGWALSRPGGRDRQNDPSGMPAQSSSPHIPATRCRRRIMHQSRT